MRYTYILCVSVAACLSWPVVWSAAAYADLGDQLFKLLPDDGAADDWFGWSVAISPDGIGTTAIVGALWDDDNGTNSGSAYLFDASFCPWDLDDNAVVGVSDLLSLLASWGPCPPKGDCPADFDNSNDVGVKDLLMLLGNWGPCP